MQQADAPALVVTPRCHRLHRDDPGCGSL
jgi:hypothetical protein